MKTNLCHEIFLANKLTEKYYARGDSAFMNTNNFLTPFEGINIDVYKDSFNYFDVQDFLEHRLL